MRALAGLLVVGLVAGACTSGSTGSSPAGRSGQPLPPQRSARSTPAVQALDPSDVAALLLLMTDQLLFEPFGIREIYQEHPEHHVDLAVALGRIGDPRGRGYLQAMLADPVPEVRRAAAFALGLIGDRRAYPVLLGALVDRDREVGRWAVDALVRLESPLTEILPALEGLPAGERWQRLLPSLFRFTADEVHEVEAALESGAAGELEPALERWLLFALARSGDARGLGRLRLALGHTDPWLRGWAARALGRLGDSSDVAGLTTLLEADEAGVVAQSLRACFALAASGRAAAPSAWLASLERLLDDERSWVRLTAAEVAGAWSLSDPSAEPLARRLRELAAGENRIAELALESLARAGDVESEQLISRAASSERASMRRAAIAAADHAGFEKIIERLARDAEPSVRLSALAVRLGEGPEESSTAANSARKALLDPDPAVRAVTLDWLASSPVAPIDELLLALTGAGASRLPDLQVNGAAALAKRAGTEPLERGAIVAALERLSRDPEYLVRRAARVALASLDREAPALGTVTTTRKIRAYREIVESTAGRRFARLEITAGRFLLELDCSTAPLTCLSFLQLASGGFYDGLRFHRVIPDFVAQGGDPRGDGWGGPGFSLRDENSSTEYVRGVVGMARSDRHTAGSQFFLTLSPQPHLTGRYTAFGRVIAGHEFLDAIEQGDEILEIREIEDPRAVPRSFSAR